MCEKYSIKCTGCAIGKKNGFFDDLHGLYPMDSLVLLDKKTTFVLD